MGEVARNVAWNLAPIVAHYVEVQRPRAHAELASFAAEPTLAAAVRRAALTLLADGRRDPHHLRRAQEDLDRAATKLAAQLTAIAACKSFGTLHEVVHGAVRHVGKLGDLYVYDTAMRIGAKLDVRPDRIFLHSGTLTGAKRLGLAATSKRPIWPSDLPSELAPLRELAPFEIEDLLRLYKDKLVADVLVLSAAPAPAPEPAPDDPIAPAADAG